MSQQALGTRCLASTNNRWFCIWHIYAPNLFYLGSMFLWYQGNQIRLQKEYGSIVWPAMCCILWTLLMSCTYFTLNTMALFYACQLPCLLVPDCFDASLWYAHKWPKKVKNSFFQKLSRNVTKKKNTFCLSFTEQ